MTGSVGSASPEQQFGRAVRAARQSRGWSQEALAAELARVGLNVGGQSGVARIERGERPTRLNEVVAIADCLGIDLNLDFGYGQAATLSQMQDVERALLDVEARLAEVVEQHEATTRDAHSARATLQMIEERLTELTMRRRELERARSNYLHGLKSLADARRQLEQITEMTNGE